MQTFLFLFSFYLTTVVSSSGYATYHMYNSNDPVSMVSCSNGANGLMAKGINTLSPLYPYVTAWNSISWNSPMCGTCIRLTNRANGNSIFVTAIDQCGNPPSGFDAHFDIAQPAFNELFGQQGINDGNGKVEWSTAPSSSCSGGENLDSSSSVPLPIPFKSVNTGFDNSGWDNSGSDNSGSDNSGSDNSGWDNSDNSGSDNSGSGNSGWDNSDNSGSGNSGWDNTGSDNSGSDNSGWDNSGSSNSGSDNSGWDNSGSSNSGSDNSGWDNSGSDNSGWDNSGSDGQSGDNFDDWSDSNNADSVSERSPDSHDNHDNSFPGWGVGLIVLGCLIVVLGVALLLVFLRR